MKYNIKTIGIVIYEGFDSLDTAGPNQVFYIMSGLDKDRPVKLFLIGPEKGVPVKSLEGLHWVPDLGYGDPLMDKDGNIVNDNVLDMIFVPGGYGSGFNELLENDQAPFYDFLKSRAKEVQLVTSVCVGSLLLARIGLLDGFKCTTHWAFKNSLELFPKPKVVRGFPRSVKDRNRITGGGISSGIDEALGMVEMLRGRKAAWKVQMQMQYIPKPPFNNCNPFVKMKMNKYMCDPNNWNAEVYDIVKGLPK